MLRVAESHILWRTREASKDDAVDMHAEILGSTAIGCGCSTCMHKWIMWGAV